MKERNEIIDISKGVLIALVTLGHIIQFITIGMGGEEKFFKNELFAFIYSFHMPAFMIISGYLFYFTSWNKSPLTILKRKCNQLLLPILAWNALGYFTIYLPLHYKELVSISIILKSIIDFATLWFLLSVLINSVFALLIRIVCDRIKCISGLYYKVLFQLGVLLFTMILGMVIPIAGQYTYMLPCFYAGFMLAQFNINIFNKNKKDIVQLLFCALFVALLPFYSVEKYVYTTGVYVTEFRQIFVDLYRWFIGVCGTFFLIFLLKNVNLTGCKNLKLLGKYTLPIYSMQSLYFTCFLYPLGEVLGRYFDYSGILVNIISIIVTIPIIFLMMRISRGIEKNKILRLAFEGGR